MWWLYGLPCVIGAAGLTAEAVGLASVRRRRRLWFDLESNLLESRLRHTRVAVWRHSVLCACFLANVFVFVWKILYDKPACAQAAITAIGCVPLLILSHRAMMSEDYSFGRSKHWSKAAADWYRTSATVPRCQNCFWIALEFCCFADLRWGTACWLDPILLANMSLAICGVVVSCPILCRSTVTKPLSTTEGLDDCLPQPKQISSELHASLLDWLCFRWAGSLESSCLEMDRAACCYAQLKHYSCDSLLQACWRMARPLLTIGLALELASDAFFLLNIVVIESILNLSMQLVTAKLVGAVLIAGSMATLSRNHAQRFTYRGVARVTASLTLMVQRGVLMQQGHTQAIVKQLLTQDVHAAARGLKSVSALAHNFIKLVFTGYLLYRLSGSLAAIAVLSVTILASLPTPRWNEVSSDVECVRLEQFKDVLRTIHAIKTYSWEDAVLQQLGALRETELRDTTFAQSLYFVAHFLRASSPELCQLTIVGITALVNRQALTPSLLFPSFFLLDILEQCLSEMCSNVAHLFEGLQAFDNLQTFADLPPMDVHLAVSSASAAVTCSKLTVQSLDGKYLVKDLAFELPETGLLLIHSDVKAAPLLEGLLKHAQLGGRVAYCTRHPWVIPASLKDNILMGQPFEAQRYHEIVEACGLSSGLAEEEDLSTRALTTDQKQRIALARTLYSDADIYMLDDTLGHVTDAKYLISSVINGFLANRAVILVISDMSEADCLWQRRGQVRILELKSDGEFAWGSRKVAARARQLSEYVCDSQDLPVSQTDARIRREAHEYYLTQLGGFGTILYGSMCWLLSGISLLYAVVFLAYWTTHPMDRNWAYKMYVAGWLGYTSTQLFLVHSILRAAARVGRGFHQGLLRGVVHASQSYLCQTSKDRLLSTFGEALRGASVDLPQAFYRHQWNRFRLTTLFLTVSVTMPVTCIALVPAYLAYEFVSRCNARGTQRLIETSESLQTNIARQALEVCENAQAIASQGCARLFWSSQAQLVDQWFSAHYALHMSNRRASLYIDLLVTLILGAVCLCKGIFRCNVNGGMCGLALLCASRLMTHMRGDDRVIGTVEVSRNTALEMNRAFRSVEQCHILHTELVAAREDYQGLRSTNSSINSCLMMSEHKEHIPAVEFKNASFQYTSNADFALKNLSFHLKSGEKLGVYGRPGAGKRTLILALLRLYELTEGSICIHGRDIKEYGVGVLRRKMSVIPRDPTLLRASLRSNLDPLREYPDEALCIALEKSGLSDLVTNGTLDRPLAEFALNRSQRQQLALARVLVRKCPILLKAEPLEPIDSDIDKQLRECIRNEFKSATIITICDRIDVLQDCDRILWLEDGRMRLTSTPSELRTIFSF